MGARHAGTIAILSVVIAFLWCIPLVLPSWQQFGTFLTDHFALESKIDVGLIFLTWKDRWMYLSEVSDCFCREAQSRHSAEGAVSPAVYEFVYKIFDLAKKEDGNKINDVQIDRKMDPSAAELCRWSGYLWAISIAIVVSVALNILVLFTTSACLSLAAFRNQRRPWFRTVVFYGVPVMTVHLFVLLGIYLSILTFTSSHGAKNQFFVAGLTTISYASYIAIILELCQVGLAYLIIFGRSRGALPLFADPLALPLNRTRNGKRRFSYGVGNEPPTGLPGAPRGHYERDSPRFVPRSRNAPWFPGDLAGNPASNPGLVRSRSADGALTGDFADAAEWDRRAGSGPNQHHHFGSPSAHFRSGRALSPGPVGAPVPAMHRGTSWGRTGAPGAGPAVAHESMWNQLNQWTGPGARDGYARYVGQLAPALYNFAKGRRQ